MAAHSFHELFCVVFKIFYAILQKFCTLIRVYRRYSGQKIAAGFQRTTIGLYFRDFTLSAPPGHIMNL